MAIESLETNPYGPHSSRQPRATRTSYYEDGLGTKQTVLVLVIVVGCFAVLWPNLIYPLLFGSSSKHGPSDSGCCDVISELDVDTIKIMSELCSTIIDDSGQTSLTPKEIVSQCRRAVLETCGIDISAALQDRISLGQSVKQILEEVRSLNGSLCLKYNFGVSPWKLGVPHRVNINLDPANTIRQERPPNMHPGMVHPAFKERGRAIPETDDSAARKRSKPPPRIVEGKPGPVPGMRAAMAGHQVAAPKQSTYGFMGFVMPMYTIGFVIFFSYTIMKLLLTKKPDDYVGSPLYPPCDTDEQFHKEVFEANKHYFNRPNKDTSKIGDEELDQLRKRLRETELAMERIVSELAKGPLIATQVRSASNDNIDEIRANGSLPKEDEQGSVTVMGMETTASSESGKKWSRPDSPVLPHPQPAAPKEPSPPPQQIFLEGALPPQSQILVADSATEAQKDVEDDSPVVLAGKMTLSVISVDSEPGTEKTGSSDEDRRRSSSNISEDFEKINAAELEDQINHIIEEAEQIASAEENRLSLNEELDTLPNAPNDVVAEENRYSLREELVELPQAPNINEKEFEQDILEEIKNQFNLEDDLMRVLKEKEPEGKVSMPVTDIIKEFLNNEENILQTVDDFAAHDNKEHAGEIEENISDKETKQEPTVKTEPEKLISTETSREELIEPLTAEEQIVSPQKEAAGENLYTAEQFIESVPPKEQQEIGDVEELEVAEDDILTTEYSKATEQFLQSEASSDLIQPKEQQSIDLVENKSVQDLGVTEEGLLTPEHSRIQSETSISDSIQHKEKQSIDLVENKSVQDLEVTEEGLLTPEHSRLQSETSISDSIHRKEQQETGLTKSQDVEELEGTRDGIFATTEQFLQSEAASELIQPKELQEIDLMESKDVQELDVTEEGHFITEPSRSTEQFLKSEASSDFVQPREQPGLIQTRHVQESSAGETDEPIKSHEEENVDKTLTEEQKIEDESQSEEKATTNKADLLLQGLMVKDTVESSEDLPMNTLEASTSTKRSTPEADIKDDATTELKEEDPDVLDIEEQEIEDIEYQDESEDDLDEDELRGDEGIDYEDRESAERRLNGDEGDSTRNGAGNSETAAENDISEDDLENEDDEEIEEIIEYVDNTDEEGEEIVEINGNERRHLNENGAH